LSLSVILYSWWNNVTISKDPVSICTDILDSTDLEIRLWAGLSIRTSSTSTCLLVAWCSKHIIVTEYPITIFSGVYNTADLEVSTCACTFSSSSCSTRGTITISTAKDNIGTITSAGKCSNLEWLHLRSSWWSYDSISITINIGSIASVVFIFTNVINVSTVWINSWLLSCFCGIISNSVIVSHNNSWIIWGVFKGSNIKDFWFRASGGICCFTRISCWIYLISSTKANLRAISSKIKSSNWESLNLRFRSVRSFQLSKLSS